MDDFVNINKVSESTAAALKSTTGWYLPDLENNGNGTDEFGLNFLPGGMLYYKYEDGKRIAAFKGIREAAYILVPLYDGPSAQAYVISAGNMADIQSSLDAEDAFSVRCVMDKDWTAKIGMNQ